MIAAACSPSANAALHARRERAVPRGIASATAIYPARAGLRTHPGHGLDEYRNLHMICLGTGSQGAARI